MVTEQQAVHQAAPLRVAVRSGNLAWVGQPLLLGHYRSTALTGTEAVVDRLVGGVLRASLAAGLYPDAPGAHQVFLNRHHDPDNPWLDPRPAAAVVVGLGDEGQLSGQALSAGVSAAVLSWVSRARESAPSEAIDLALTSTLMGSGSAAFSPGDSARAVALGVRDANQKLAQHGWPVIERLTLIELFMDRAADAWYGLNVLATSAPSDFSLAAIIESGIGPLRRPLATAYRGTDADLLCVANAGEGATGFALHTDRAAGVVRALSAQAGLSRKLVEHAKMGYGDSVQLGRTLFALLVAPEIAPFFAGTRRLVLELDSLSAGLPWELLDPHDGEPAVGEERPWAIRTRLLRRFSRSDYRQRLQASVANAAILVIGEPAANPALYAPLPGARVEAQAVAELLASSGALEADRVVALIDGNEAAEVFNALFQRPYRIVHIAGHLDLPYRDTGNGAVTTPGGIVLSGGASLRAGDFAQMLTVPELVIASGGYLPADGGSSGPTNGQRAEAAQALAQSLLEIGVRCVVIAGWSVHDGAARTFAMEFYRALLSGRSFVDAVAAARDAAWQADPISGTWAAYQCYGDPHWRLRSAGGDPQMPRESAPFEYEGVASPMQLVVALDALAVGTRHQDIAPQLQAEGVRMLETRFASLWGHMGVVAEAFGAAWAACGEHVSAIGWYERAVGAADRGATMKAQEQLANLRIRQAWAQAQQGETSGTGNAAREVILRGVEELTRLVAQSPTRELMSLCGNAWRRLGMLELQRGHAGSARAAFKQARESFASAMSAAAAAGERDLFYSGLNKIALDLLLALDEPAGSHRPGRIEPVELEAVRRSLDRAVDEAPDFWSHAGIVELDVYVAVSEGVLASRAVALQEAYSQLHQRVASPALWQAAASPVSLVLTRYRAMAVGAERRAASALERLLGGYGDVIELPTPEEADVVIWHGARDSARAQRLASRLTERGLHTWSVAEAVAQVNSTRDAELHYRVERAKACVLVFRLDGGEPGRNVQHDWQQLMVAIDRRNAKTATPALVSWTAGEGELPPFLRDYPQVSGSGQGEAEAATSIAAMLHAKQKRSARKGTGAKKPRSHRETRG